MTFEKEVLFCQWDVKSSWFFSWSRRGLSYRRPANHLMLQFPLDNNISRHHHVQTSQEETSPIQNIEEASYYLLNSIRVVWLMTENTTWEGISAPRTGSRQNSNPALLISTHLSPCLPLKQLQTLRVQDGRTSSQPQQKERHLTLSIQETLVQGLEQARALQWWRLGAGIRDHRCTWDV